MTILPCSGRAETDAFGERWACSSFHFQQTLLLRSFSVEKPSVAPHEGFSNSSMIRATEGCVSGQSQSAKVAKVGTYEIYRVNCNLITSRSAQPLNLVGKSHFVLSSGGPRSIAFFNSHLRVHRAARGLCFFIGAEADKTIDVVVHRFSACAIFVPDAP